MDSKGEKNLLSVFHLFSCIFSNNPAQQRKPYINTHFIDIFIFKTTAHTECAHSQKLIVSCHRQHLFWDFIGFYWQEEEVCWFWLTGESGKTNMFDDVKKTLSTSLPFLTLPSKKSDQNWSRRIASWYGGIASRHWVLDHHDDMWWWCGNPMPR